MTEAALGRKILFKLRARGGVWFPYPRTRFASSGVSDIIGCLNGRFVAIELKLPGEKWKPTRLQVSFIDRIIAAEGIAFIAHSWEEIEEALSHNE